MFLLVLTYFCCLVYSEERRLVKIEELDPNHALGRRDVEESLEAMTEKAVEVEIKLEKEVSVQPKLNAEVGAELGTQAKEEVEPEVKWPAFIVTETMAKKDPKSKSELKVEANTDIGIKAKAEVRSKLKAKMKGEIKTELEMESGSVHSTEVEVKELLRPEVEANMKTTLQPKAETVVASLLGTKGFQKSLLNVLMKTKAEVELKFRSNSNAEIEREMGTRVEEQVEFKPKWQAYVVVGTAAEKNAKLKYKVKVKANTETKKREKDEVKFAFKPKTQTENKAGVEKETRSGLSLELEKKIKEVLKKELKANEEAILQANPEAEVVQGPETRRFPESIFKALTYRPSQLLKPRGLKKLESRTIKPFLEYIKTACRNLPIKYNYLISSFRRLMSGISFGRGERRSATRTLSSSDSQIQQADIGPNSLISKQDLKTSPEKRGDGAEVAIERVGASDVPPESQPKVSPKTSPKTSPKISPDPSRRSLTGSPPKPEPKSPPKEMKFDNRSGMVYEKSGGTGSAEEDVSKPRTQPQSPTKSPSKAKSELQSKERRAANGDGVIGGEMEEVSGTGSEIGAPKIPPHWVPKSSQRSPPRPVITSPSMEKKGGNAVEEKISPLKKKKGTNGGIEKISPPKQKKGANGEGTKKSPPKEKKEGNGGEAKVPRSRYPFNLDPKRLRDFRESFAARLGKTVEELEDERDRRERIISPSSQFRGIQFRDGDAWKKLDKEYGHQESF